MGIAGSLMVFAISWWIAFLVLLPFGIRSHLEQGKVEPGTDPSAPVSPGLGPKAIWAFLIAIVLWAVLFSAIEYKLILIDDIPIPMGIRWN